MITIEAIGAPITEADNAAIPASINESPKLFIPKLAPKYVKIPPSAAPSTNAGEKTPPKKPMLRQIIVTNNLRKRIKIINDKVYDLSSKPRIVSPPNPKTSGTKPPTIPTINVAHNIL